LVDSGPPLQAPQQKPKTPVQIHTGVFRNRFSA
jgi:hypothetical protein